MGEAILILYLAGTGMTFKPVRVPFPTHDACSRNAERERDRGHIAYCLRRSGVRPCANCGAPMPPVG